VLREPLGPDLYPKQKRDDPAFLRLLAKVEVVADEEADRLFFEEQRLRQTVEIALADGSLLQRELEFPGDKPRTGSRRSSRSSTTSTRQNFRNDF